MSFVVTQENIAQPKELDLVLVLVDEESGTVSRTHLHLYQVL